MSDAWFADLERELAQGPAEHGWEDQRLTLARIRTLIWRTFELDCSSAAVWRLPHRHGWSWQSPARWSLERDEDAVGLWKRAVAARGMTAAALEVYVVFEDEAGFSMTPSVARTRSRRDTRR
ncbi:winged helix-turn-helix domain-containing protein [Streptomyces sp. NPDC095817]|uniref:helix-turn-helix domain-containing protein n=1 Tax=Streptomyces sp. NPDC095817 TaxID=3155082 RepID=UPI003328ADE0